MAGAGLALVGPARELGSGDHNLAKVGLAGSNLVVCSKKSLLKGNF
jgi:hypothetical protein